MAEPYRWGDVAPPAVQAMKGRRRYRASEFFGSLKRYRRERLEAEQADPSLGQLSKAEIATAENQSPYPGGTRR